MSLLFYLFGLRMWYLYHRHTLCSVQIKMIWRKAVDEQYRHWVLSYPFLGDMKIVNIFSFIALLIFNTIINIILYYTEFNDIFSYIAAGVLAIINLLIFILTIKLHQKHSIDNNKIRQEFTIDALVITIILGCM